jgi:hypothetical protein
MLKQVILTRDNLERDRELLEVDDLDSGQTKAPS